MKRSYLLIAMGLLAVGIVFDWRLSGAHDGEQQDHEQPVSALQAVQPDEISQVADLVERLKALEKRLAAVEGREPLVRQADSRESTVDYQTTSPPPAKIPAIDDRDSDEENATQNTNGQKWRFRLLGRKN